jgi:glycosyltransferase involved in cell wall biosynthesis
MNSESRDPSALPTRWQGFIFQLKTSVFRVQRGLRELRNRPEKHEKAAELRDAATLGEIRSPLWTQLTPAEFPLTAGKVENLRVVAKALDGLEIPAGEVFSFWRQIGRTTKKRGYTVGRELREGCMVPNIGGGLCQVTGLLYQAALKAGLEVVERHEHSRLVTGSMGEQNLDATVFWNYVDLRFRADFRWRIEVRLSASELSITIKAVHGAERPKATLPRKARERELPTGDCLTCNQVECFRHPSATAEHAPGQGHSAYLLDARWPKFDRWCAEHSWKGDRWMTPLDGERWKKPNYAWTPPGDVTSEHATVPVLLRSFRQRRFPAQGAIRQAALLESDARLAEFYARKLSPECRHLVVSQNLLPHLWKLGTLGGRTFDALIERWPLEELQKRLDQGAKHHPKSPTLADFRADPELVRVEREALANAGRLITPHQEMAKHFGHRAWLLEWQFPEVDEARREGDDQHSLIFFPCSPLGRKGVYELAGAMEGLDLELLILGGARENGAGDPLKEVNWRPANFADLSGATALVLPAWIEHQSRIALRALAMGIPVIASRACGLPPHPLLKEIEVGAVDELREALLGITRRRAVA